MRRSLSLLLAPLVSLLCLEMPAAAAEKQTVCTITVNSPDEKETFRRHLPESRYRFVELVERGRPDWLASACRAAVRCDVLVISGHFDGSTDFFSDQLEVGEFLPVAELERVSCSDSCPGLFARLKEVYLFGCNTLNPQPQSSASAEVLQAMVREGHSRKEAERLLQSLSAAHGENSRDRMRQIFDDVPVIYGFSSAAPLGPVAASTLSRYLRSGGTREIGSGHASGRLLGYFAPFSMAVAQGMTPADPHVGARRDMCQFADERLTAATRLAFVHGLLQRHVAETRLYLDRIQHLMKSLDTPTRQTPAVARALQTIAQDQAARARFLAFERDAEPTEVRARLVDLAHGLGWLSADERWEELAQMLGTLLERDTVGPLEVGLACNLNRGQDLDGMFNRRVAAGSPADAVAHAAVRACLGSAEGRARTLEALVGADEADVRIAQTYLRHRPITDPAELRRIAGDIARMSPSEAQVSALESLSRHYLSDREVVDLLVSLFAQTPSEAVQDAIAGILIRADRRSVAGPQVLRTVVQNRRPSGAEGGMVDALIQRLQLP